jgi:hypothetical protein
MYPFMMKYYLLSLKITKKVDTKSAVWYQRHITSEFVGLKTDDLRSGPVGVYLEPDKPRDYGIYPSFSYPTPHLPFRVDAHHFYGSQPIKEASWIKLMK